MANNLAAFTPIKFSLKLVELLYNDTLYKSITNTDYDGEIKEAGDRVRVRTAARVSLSNYTKGQVLVKQDLNPTSEELSLHMLVKLKTTCLNLLILTFLLTWQKMLVNQLLLTKLLT
jgi:hypothetical protein